VVFSLVNPQFPLLWVFNDVKVLEVLAPNAGPSLGAKYPDQNSLLRKSVLDLCVVNRSPYCPYKVTRSTSLSSNVLVEVCLSVSLSSGLESGRSCSCLDVSEGSAFCFPSINGVVERVEDKRDVKLKFVSL